MLHWPWSERDDCLIAWWCSPSNDISYMHDTVKNLIHKIFRVWRCEVQTIKAKYSWSNPVFRANKSWGFGRTQLVLSHGFQVNRQLRLQPTALLIIFPFLSSFLSHTLHVRAYLTVRVGVAWVTSFWTPSAHPAELDDLRFYDVGNVFWCLAKSNVFWRFLLKRLRYWIPSQLCILNSFSQLFLCVHSCTACLLMLVEAYMIDSVLMVILLNIICCLS